MSQGMIFFLILFMVFSPVHLIAAEPSLQKNAPPPAEPSPGEELGYGFGSVLASLFYSPAKVTYAGLGLLTGGLGFLLSAGNADVANNIIYPSVRGNYVVTPRHLKGEEPLIFIGAPPPPPEPQQPQQAASPPSTPVR